MSRKPNLNARPYVLTPEARAQRKQAAIERWKAMPNKSDRREVLRPAFTVTPGRPRKVVIVRKPRHAVRDEATGKFVRSK